MAAKTFTFAGNGRVTGEEWAVHGTVVDYG